MNDKAGNINIQSESIAIIGIGCKFPGANNYDEFWENLDKGVNSVTEIPPERWNLDNFYSSNIELPNTSTSKWGGFLEDVDKFDAKFFQMSEREARRTDPQQRIMLELSWSCLEDAGYSPLELSGNNVGVFIGVCNFDYKELQDKGEFIEGYNSTGTYTSIIPNRISYFFNFHGPSIPIDTACSSSLVAIHQAVNALNQNECEMALVGGVNVLCTPTSYISFSKLGMLSPEGKCKTFDAQADGYVRGEGAGVILLKPLKKAIEDKNYIYGIIKGSAINHGGHARTLTSPNAYSQSQVLRSAYIKANITPDTVSYIEAHGTGTPLGDPIEINALKRAYTQLYQHYGIEPTTESYCGLSSVKTNIGHLESAAGIAGIIKVVLAMKYKKLPKVNDFQQLNPRIKLDDSPFYIVKETKDWQHLKTKEGKIIPRRAGVSSFGFGGVNAHVILEESSVPEEIVVTNIERPSHLMALSAKTQKALEELVRKYQTYLISDLKISLANICYTANTGRSHFDYRLAIVANSTEQLVDQLTAFASRKDTAGLISDQPGKKLAKIVFLFTGQGSQYINMGRQLYDSQPIFRQTIEQCDEILRPYLKHSLLEVLYPTQALEQVSFLLDQTAYTQPALFAFEYALYQLWKSWGIEPNVVMGHSVGEYVAATVAGVFSLEDGLKLIVYRGQLMQQLPSGGEMVSLMASEERVREIIAPFHDTVALAAINGPESVVISGDSEDIAAICQQLSTQGVKTKRLQVSHAFHSPFMTPMLKEFEQVASQITYNQPHIPLISNITGQFADENITNAQYWVNHIRQTVRFADSMQTLYQLGHEVFLEVGPKPILLGMVRECLPESVGLCLPSLRPGVPEWQQLLSSLGKLYVNGMAVDWSGFDRDYFRKKVTLPTYPFQRQRYWIENSPPKPQRQQNLTKLHPLLGKKLQLPLSKEILYESEFSSRNIPFLVDHQVYNQIVVPGACYLSLLLGATGLTFASESCLLENIVFPQALVIPEDKARTVQLVLSFEESSTSFKLISFDTVLNGSTQVNQWLVHATGKISQGVKITPETVFLQQIQTRCTQQIAAVEISQSWQKRQIHFGASFQWLDCVWCGEGEVLAKLKWLDRVNDLEEYQLYPGLLDSCLQLTSFFFPSEDTFVPFAIESFQFYQRPQSQHLWCHTVRCLRRTTPTQSENSETDNLVANIRLFDDNGQLIADIKGFEAKKATPNTLLQSLQLDFKENSLENWLYEVEWQPQVRFSNEQLSPNYLPALAEISPKLQLQYSQLMAEPQLKVYEAAVSQLEALSIKYVLQALTAMGWKLQLGQRFTTTAIANQLGVVSQHQRLFKRLLEMLAEVGVLEIKALEWQVIREPEDSNPQAELNALLTQYPIANAELTLLGRCGPSLAQVLRGECDALQLLFPENDSTTAQLYENSPLTKVVNILAQQAIVSLVEHLPTGRGLRILEIGAGTGGTTSYLLPHLSCEQTEYHFTDIGISFTTKAQEKFRDFPFVRYEVLDIEKDPLTQGFKQYQYDVIVAANVLHATQDLRETLKHAKQLLAPQGILILLETTQRQRWLDLIFGLTPGWWRFGDLDLRPDYPLISDTQWHEVLQETGFTSTVNLVPSQHTQSVLSKAMVMLAQVPPLAAESVQVEPKRWLLLADGHGMAQQLAAKLHFHSQVCTLVFAGEEYEQLDQQQFKINPANPEHYQKLLQAINSDVLPLNGVVHCWSLDTVKAAQLTADDLAAASLLGCGSTLHLIQALTGANFSAYPRLWLVTQGAVAVTNLEGVAQSSLWGMARAIAREYPELNCVRIDLPPKANAEVVQALFEEIWLPTTEDQIALDGQLRYVARLTRYQKTKDSAHNRLEIPQNQPYKLEISARGSVENLTLQPGTRRQPELGELEILVHATGLNFKDVLGALGWLPVERDGLGFECTGKVVAVGAEVEGFEIGDEVVAIASGSFSQYVTVNAQLVVHKPHSLSFAEAATIPIAFLTAYYALHHQTKISAGDRILIHAAAGGTGLAAVQLAQQAGAEVFATASPGKWEFLKSLGLEHIMNSRTLDFSSQVLEITHGQGVDIVLNSLTSAEFIRNNLAVLNAQGRFIELGKRGVWQVDEIQKVRSDISYFLVDLMQICQQQPTFIQSMLCHLMQQFKEGKLKPLQQTVFPIHNVVDAFSYMQQAKHIGKIVITHPGAIMEKAAHKLESFRDDSTYLISGGMGGLGLLVARWMVQKGARHLVLVGRSSVSVAASNQIKELEQAGAQVIIAQADVSQAEQITKVLREIKQSLPPLRGIIHAAGVLDDGVLQQQNWQRFTKVLAPKIQGAWHLHSLTNSQSLDFFVLFSSVASLLGSTGQSNHAAANAFLDALAHYRQAQGLTGLSINWGAWSQIGAFAERQIDQQAKMRGIETISPDQGLIALEQLLCQSSAQVGVMSINWWQLLSQSTLASPLFTNLTQTRPQGVEKKAEFRTRLEAANANERKQLLINHVSSQVAKVIGWDVSQTIDLQQGFFELGMDSLTALELRNSLQKSLGCSLPSSLTFTYPTITKLVDYLAKEVLLLDSGMELNGKSPTTDLEQVATNSYVEDLSDSEAEALLLQKLESINY